LLIGAIAVVVVVIAELRSAKEKRSSDTGAMFSVVHDQSFCGVGRSDARITFHVAFRNTGSAAGLISFRPWRRYNDGSTNDGSRDITEPANVAAGAIRDLRAMVPGDARHGAPVACRAYVGNTGSRYFAIRVKAS